MYANTLNLAIIAITLSAFHRFTCSAQRLTSIEHFCTYYADNVEFIFHIGDYLLLSFNRERIFDPLDFFEFGFRFDHFISDNEENKKFFVFNWKTGGLFRRALSQDDLFADILRSDMVIARGDLIFVATMHSCTFTVEGCSNMSHVASDQFVMATYSSKLSTMESYACQDFDSINKEFLRTQLYRLESNEDKFLPKLISYGTDVDMLKYRGQIESDDSFMTIRTDLSCDETLRRPPDYLNGFYIMDRLWVQTRAGFVQHYPYGSEIPIARFLNCGLPMFGPRRSLPRRLKLVSNNLNMTTGKRAQEASSKATVPPTTFEAVMKVLALIVLIAGALVLAFFMANGITFGIDALINAVGRMLNYQSANRPPAYCSRLNSK